MSLKEKIESLSPKDKKMFILSFVLIVVSSIVLIGTYFSSIKDETHQKRIDVVKRGKFNDYSKNSIGFLLENWKNCDSVVWGYFQNKKQEEFVEVYCYDTGNFLPLIEYMKELSDEPYAGLSSHKIVLQWRLTGAKSFTIDFVGEVLGWVNGHQSIKEYQNSQSGSLLFKKILANEKMFDETTIKENLLPMSQKIKEIYKKSVIVKN